MTNETDAEVKGAYASLYAAKKLQERWDDCFCGPFIDKSRRRVKTKKIQSIRFVGECSLIIANQFAGTKQEACDGIIDDLLVKVLQITQKD